MKLSPVQITPPAAGDPVVTLADAKAAMKVEHDDEDTLIVGLIAAAVADLDGYSGILGRCLVSQEWEQSLPCFSGRMCLPLAPVSAVQEIRYFPADGGDELTLSGSVYRFHPTGIDPYVTLISGQSYPAIAPRDDAVTIKFTAGYGAAADVPEDIKQAIKLTVAHWYANREDVTFTGSPSQIPMGAERLLAKHRRIHI